MEELIDFLRIPFLFPLCVWKISFRGCTLTPTMQDIVLQRVSEGAFTHIRMLDLDGWMSTILSFFYFASFVILSFLFF